MAVNLMYITQNYLDEIAKKLPEQVIGELVAKSIQIFKSDPNYDNTPVINLLMKIRKSDSVFKLLNQE